ncbi:MAG TPA: heparan-alpha-glucosaminide N-acetyltransferase domain-containing protein [Ohtaekwangia sp.]|uniref:DUF1624 domain-containing protein n=1 Tax=Ohtaekwangia sp. TaxID=2066019 RepID=UPI002F9371DE
MKRISSIDFTRGFVMIIMALDHVRDLIHVDAIKQSPMDFATTTPVLFFTRWITYLCAPIFVFLAGVSVYRYRKSKNDIAATRKFLVTRGLWLIVLEFTVVNFGLYFDFGFHFFIFEVIAAIGVGFIVLSFLQKLSIRAIGIIGAVIVVGHNALPAIPFSEGSVIKMILQPLFGPGLFPITSQTMFFVGYPPIPWLGIMLLGFTAGTLFDLPDDVRVKRFLQLGVGALLLFVVLRFVNIYGDPVPWSAQKDSIYTFLSFINITKYPPSLLFCSVTLGFMFLILAFAERFSGKWMEFVLVYGRVPMFYFLIHFYLIHFTMLAILLLQGFSWSQLEFATGTFGRPANQISGLSLGPVYIIWIAMVLALYIPCQWYGRYKAEHNYWWLKYI